MSAVDLEARHVYTPLSLYVALFILSAPFFDILNFFDCWRYLWSFAHCIFALETGPNSKKKTGRERNLCLNLYCTHLSNLFTGHLIFTWVPRNTWAVPPIFSETFFLAALDWTYVWLIALAITGRSVSTQDLVLQGFLSGGFIAGHIEVGRSMMWFWAITCLHWTVLCEIFLRLVSRKRITHNRRHECLCLGTLYYVPQLILIVVI